jgi:hypothetical protein
VIVCFVDICRIVDQSLIKLTFHNTKLSPTREATLLSCLFVIVQGVALLEVDYITVRCHEVQLYKHI